MSDTVIASSREGQTWGHGLGVGQGVASGGLGAGQGVASGGWAGGGRVSHAPILPVCG